MAQTLSGVLHQKVQVILVDIPQVVNRYILLSTKPNPQTKIIQKLQSILMMKGL